MANAKMTYDATNMMSPGVKRGTSKQDLKRVQARLRKAKEAVIQLADSGEQGWLALPDDKPMLQRIETMVVKMRHFEDVLVIGIGGSDLATRAIWSALRPPERESKVRLWFAGANTDPDELTEILDAIDFKRTLVVVVSKSGGTIEPMATFAVVREKLRKTIGHGFAKHILAVTDEETGALRQLAEREGYATLPVPGNVGGRFSALTDVALFPLAMAGVDVRGLLRGAKDVRDEFLSNDAERNGACLFAALNYLAATKQRQQIQVLMPYAERLRGMGFWYRQIWAESLGKQKDRNGRDVFTGPTPVAALGATDQHSQMQLYMEGPFDKTVTFVEVDRFRHDIILPSFKAVLPSLDYASRVSMQDLCHAERKGSAVALRNAGRPNGTIHIPDMSPKSIGGLLMFFEIATGISGELYNIDAYNQPGVEAGKHAMKKFL